MSLVQINYVLNNVVPKAGDYQCSVFPYQFDEKVFRSSVLDFNLKQNDASLICTYKVEVVKTELLENLKNGNRKCFEYLIFVVASIFLITVMSENSNNFLTSLGLSTMLFMLGRSWGPKLEEDCMSINITLNFKTFKPELSAYKNELDEDGNMLDPLTSEVILENELNSLRYICLAERVMSTCACMKFLLKHSPYEDERGVTIYADPLVRGKYLTRQETADLKVTLRRVFGDSAVWLIKRPEPEQKKTQKFLKLFDRNVVPLSQLGFD